MRPLWQTISISPQSFDRPQLIWEGGSLWIRLYRIFTDGSAIGNPGPGGWGAVVMQGTSALGNVGCLFLDDYLRDGVGSSGPGIWSHPIPGARRTVWFSDSEYLIYGMRVFVFRWQRQGWRNRRGNQLQHRGLWAELIA